MKHLLICLLIVLLFIELGFITTYVEAGSETFQLSRGGMPVIRNVELQKNDRLVGSFTITNLQTWKNGWGDTVSLIVTVMILDPYGQIILQYTDTKGGSFNHTAFYSGVYTFRFYVSIGYLPPEGIQDPQATLNYEVITPQSIPNIPFTNFPVWGIPVIVGAIIIIVGALIFAVYSVVKSKRLYGEKAVVPYGRFLDIYHWEGK